MIRSALVTYAGSSELFDWATQVAGRFVRKVERVDFAGWRALSEKLGRHTRRTLASVGVGEAFTRLQAEQVRLIRSMPLESARKVHEWTEAGISRGERMMDIVDRIRTEAPHLTRSHAVLIARTETARTRTSFTQARAAALGSPGYIWRCVHDKRTRELHEDLDGEFIRWSEPPVAGYGRGGIPVHAHAGAIWNCRCSPEPVLPEDTLEE